MIGAPNQWVTWPDHTPIKDSLSSVRTFNMYMYIKFVVFARDNYEDA